MFENSLLSIDNGKDKVINADASLIATEYYTDYSKYVLEYRALPSVYDGLKPVQRRIIYTASKYPSKLMKTAKMVGAVMQYHPHGDASIEGSINDMAHPLNIFPMFTTKGNFGGVGFGASASRYTELYLSEIARQNYCQFTDYANYEIGEIGEQEPEALPCLIPYCLIKGSEGIGIGLSTKVMPLNLLDLIDYYIEYIKYGNSKLLVKPDVGYVLLEMSNNEVADAVKNYKGQIVVSSIVTQISDTTVLIEGLYDKSIDTVINKIDKKYEWFTKEQVGFKDISTTSVKYLFEIYDQSIKLEDLKTVLVNATTRTGTYTRIVEESGNAVFASLEYIVKKSLEYLNAAIDRKLKIDLDRCNAQLDIYTALEACKAAKVFNNILNLDKDKLIKNIIKASGCSDEVANEIIKKPISYLTRAHAAEIQELKDQIQVLVNHDRTKYLVKLYKEFRKAILPFFEEKKHTLLQNAVLKNPCIKFISDNNIQILDNNGVPFKSTAYFVSTTGFIYKRVLDSSSAASVIVETNHEKIAGVVGDYSKYIDVTTVYNRNSHGKVIIPIELITYDKQFINLIEGETIIKVTGLKSVPEELSDYVKGIRASQTKFIREKDIK